MLHSQADRTANRRVLTRPTEAIMKGIPRDWRSGYPFFDRLKADHAFMRKSGQNAFNFADDFRVQFDA